MAPTTSPESTTEILAGLPLLSGTPPDAIARLSALATLEDWPAGSQLFAEGDAPGDLLIVLEGRVTLCMKVPGRVDSCVLSLRAGELLGWSALLRRPRVATARVVRDARLLRFPASPLLELCELDHDVGYALLRVAFEEVAERLHHTRLQLLDIFQNPGGTAARPEA